MNLTLYSTAQPLLLDDQVVWLDLGDDDPEANSIHYLMMIGRESFIADQEEDEIISSIILNDYGTQSPMCPQAECILETIVPPLNLLNYLEAYQFLHSLLPHEMDSSPIAQLFMAYKIIKMEIGLGKELKVNNALSHSQQAMLQLLQEN